LVSKACADAAKERQEIPAARRQSFWESDMRPD